MFRKIISLIILLFALFSMSVGMPSDTITTKPCKLKGINLYGDVKIVTSNATFKVKIVSHRPYLYVRRVSYRPSECGEWRFTTFGEDFTIQFVTFGEDFTINYVNYNPGIR